MVDENHKFIESYRYGRVRLRKSVRTGIWHVKYLVPALGKYQERSTGTTLKKDAESQVDLIINPALQKQSVGVIDNSIPIRTLFDKFFEAKRVSEVKPSTLKKFNAARVMFFRWLGAFKPTLTSVKNFKVDTIREYIKYRREQGKNPRTVNHDIMNLSSAFKWGMKEGLVNVNPFDYTKATGKIRLFTIGNIKKDVYTKEEYQALINEAESRGDTLIRDFVIVAAGTGMRFEEIACMKAGWLDWNKSPLPTITIRAESGSDGFTPKHATEVKEIPMLPDVQKVLKERLPATANGLVFTNMYGRKLSNDKTRHRLQRLFPSVGINRRERKLHLHSFRRFFIKQCMEKNIPFYIFCRWTGHDSIKIAMEYAPSTYEDSVREISKIIDPIPTASNQNFGEHMGNEDTMKNKVVENQAVTT